MSSIHKKPVVRSVPTKGRIDMGVSSSKSTPTKYSPKVSYDKTNRAAKFKGSKQDIHPAGRNQYQG